MASCEALQLAKTSCSELPPRPTVTTRPAAAAVPQLGKLLSAFCSAHLRFSLLPLSLRTFLLQEGLLTTLAYPCAFSQSVFTHGLSSSHQISHFWSSLGHDGHCCVFWVVLGFLGPGESAGGHFLRSPSPFVHNHMLEQRERRRSHRDCGPSLVVRDRTSSRRAQCRASYVDVRPCATGAHRPLLTCCSSFQAGFAASQMHLSISVSSLETSDLTLLQLTVLLRVQSISLQFSLFPFSATKAKKEN